MAIAEPTPPKNAPKKYQVKRFKVNIRVIFFSNIPPPIVNDLLALTGALYVVLSYCISSSTPLFEILSISANISKV